MKILNCWLLLLLCVISFGKELTLELPNPSFEFDTYGIGVPDGWTIPESTSVRLVGKPVSDGRKAAHFTSGYILVSHEWKVEEPAGLRLKGSFDAAGIDDASIGLLIGLNRKQQDGANKFILTRMFWDRKLKPEYNTCSFDFKIPDNGVGNRLFFAVYRSNKQGEVYLDNFKLTVDAGGPQLSDSDKKLHTSLLRDYEYALSKGKSVAGAGELVKLVSQKIDLLNKADGEILKEIQADTSLESINASLNKLASGKALGTSWSDPYQRLEKDRPFPAKPDFEYSLVSLGNEYQALGVVIANGENAAIEIPVQLKGFEQFGSEMELRRQVFMTNWYQRERALTADPLTLLPVRDDKWMLNIAPGETVKLYLSFKVNENSAGQYPVEVKIGEQTLTANILVKNYALPVEPVFGHMQFMYANLAPVNSHPELAALDLKKHYVTTVEFAFMPKTEFTAEGEIASTIMKGSQQERWMKAYAGQGLELGIFWQASYKQFKIKGSDQFIPYVDEKNQLTPQWKNALVNLTKAWLDFAEKSGYGKYMSMLPVDEPSSKNEFANAPGSSVLSALEVCRTLKKAVPALPLMVTASNYTLPQDMQALLPEMDLALPHWPLPEKLTRWAPPGYDPRQEFLDKTLPMLLQAGKQRGVRLWSYHVEGGKKETPEFEYCYPMGALGLGLTGVGTWAYNVTSGRSWDDTDGKILDYSFIYNGLEDHPLNRQYNPDREVIVPSIRFKALRMGIQNAKILLALRQKMEKGELKPDTAMQVKEILEICNKIGRTAEYDYDKMRLISEQLRQIYE